MKRRYVTAAIVDRVNKRRIEGLAPNLSPAENNLLNHVIEVTSSLKDIFKLRRNYHTRLFDTMNII